MAISSTATVKHRKETHTHIAKAETNYVHMSEMFVLWADRSLSNISYWNRPYSLETIEKDGISQPHWTLQTNAWMVLPIQLYGATTNLLRPVHMVLYFNAHSIHIRANSHECEFNAHWESSHGRREKQIEARLVTWFSSKQCQCSSHSSLIAKISSQKLNNLIQFLILKLVLHPSNESAYCTEQL